MTAPLYAVVDGNAPFAADLNQFRNLFRGGIVRDVKNGYGAAGDGVTDDRAAIRSAIDAASPGDTIFFPPGVYIMASVIGPITIPLNFVGYGATMKAGANGLGGSAADSWAINFDNGGLAIDGISIRGLKFDSATRANTPVQIKTGTNVLIEDCSFTGYTFANSYHPTDSAIRLQACTRVHISRIFVKDWWYGNTAGANLHRAITLQTGCDYVVIDGLIVDTADQGIALGQTCSHITITNCEFKHLSDNGLYCINDITGLTVTDSVFDDTEEGIVLSGPTGSTTQLRHILINGNRFYATTNKHISVGGDVYALNIVGNTFENVTAVAAIGWRSANTGTWYEVNISNNLFFGPSGFALVYPPINVTGMRFEGNRMRSTFASANNFFWRNDTGGTLTDVTIKNNVMDSSGGANPGHVRTNGTISRVVIEGNALGPSDVIELFTGVTYRNQLYVNASGAFVGTTGQRDIWGTVAPTAGTWAVGDRVWQTAPASAGFMGFVCTAAGTPGTWKTFGLIS